MPTAIEVDFEVYKALTMRRSSEEVTYNDVLREILKLEPAPKSDQQDQGSWIVKGVNFPKGTVFKADYKGKEYTGSVVDGGMVVDGKKYTTPSAAAVAITSNNVNGWRFWQCKRPGETAWTPMFKLLDGGS